MVSEKVLEWSRKLNNEAMVLDARCIMPGLAQVEECYHTELISTLKVPQIKVAPISEERKLIKEHTGAEPGTIGAIC